MKLLKSAILFVGLSLVALVAFAGTGYAADAATPSDSQSLLDLLRPVFEAFAGGHYAYAAALGTIVLVALVKRYVGSNNPTSWVHSDAGGSALALVAASATALSSGLATGAAITVDMLESAGAIGVAAAGGFATVKNLLVDPFLKPLAAKPARVVAAADRRRALDLR